ncbi:MAG TPA: ferritin-like domain-containing protein [Thermoanaerobaculia bacterium]
MHNTITTRAQLMDALRLAAELEHNLMCQYLFAVYSMRRYPYERFNPYTFEEILTPAELERIRRWQMKITLIARQEMEHLGLALNLLSSIGGTPSFSRPNMPQKIGYYGPADIEMTLTPGNLDTIKRFQNFESPYRLEENFCGIEPDPEHVINQPCAEKWCSQAQTVGRDEMLGALQRPGRLLGAAPHIDLLYGIGFADVQELYETIARGFETLTQTLGAGKLFIGDPGNQIYGGPPSPLYGSMNDLNQYGLSLIAVTDLASAQQAIRMIIEQGEGVPARADYLTNTHFCLFTEIRQGMEADGGRLAEVCARPVMKNPMTVIQPDVTAPEEVNLITDEQTRLVAELSSQSYEVMLLLLLYLYSDQMKNPDQTNALMDAAFFPFMTMFVRPLAEILTELPAKKEWEQQVERGEPYRTAGPGFELAGDVVLFPNLPQTWDLFQERIDALVTKFRRVTARRPLPPPAGTLAGVDPIQPRWGWAPLNDPWLNLPTQKAFGVDAPEEFRAIYQQRIELWNKIKNESTEIAPEELEASLQFPGQSSFAPAAVTPAFDERGVPPPSLPWLRLYYLRQNMERISFDWKTNWMQIGRVS